MARFSEYVDSAYLPGEIRSSGLSDFQLYPQLRSNYMEEKMWKFQPKKDNTGDLFQQFLALQNNPEALMPKLPNTPFGNLSSYIGA